MVCAMLLSLMPFPASANGETKVWLDKDVTVTAGDNATLDLHLENNPGLYALNLYVNYTETLTGSGAPSLDKDKSGAATVWKEFKDAQQAAAGSYTFQESKRQDSANSRMALSFVVNPPDEEGYPEVPWTTNGVIASIPFKASENITEAVEAELTILVTSATGEGSEKVTVASDTCKVRIQPKEATPPATAPKVWLDKDVTVTAGDNATLDLHLENNPGLYALNLYVNYTETLTGSGAPSLDKDKSGAATVWKEFKDAQQAAAGSYTFQESKRQDSANSRMALSFVVNPPDEEGYPEVPWTTNGVIASIPFKASENITEAVEAELTILVTSATGEGSEKVTVASETCTVRIQPKSDDTFAITTVASPTEGGEVKTDPTTSAKENASVTVTVTPKTGYNVTAVTAKGTEDSAAVEVTKVNDTAYTFTMPAKPVTVEATFEQPQPHSITYPKDVEGGKVEVSAESAVAGTDITLTVTSNPGYGINALKWNDNVIPTPYTFPYTFEMPDEDVTISVSFPKEGYNINYTLTPENGGRVVSRINGESVNTATVGDKVTLTPQAAENFEYVDGSLKVTGETSGDIALTNNEFTMPAENVTVTATFKEKVTEPYIITYPEETEGGAVSGPKEAYEGDPVKLTVTPDEGYDIQLVTLNQAPLAAPYEFDMPAYNVTVDAQFVKHPYNIAYTLDPEEGGSVNVPETAVFDEEVTVNLDVADGYRPLEVTVDGEKVEDVNGVVTFTMPKNDVEVNVTFAKLYNIKYVASPTNGGSVKDGSTEAVLGEEIELTATANEDADYDFVEFTVVGDESEKPVEVKDGNKFVMPEENVTVTAWFTQPTRTIDSVATPAEGGAVKTDPTSAKKGSAVKVTVTPKAGYSVEKVTMNGEELTQAADGTYVFTMPAKPVTVEATFAPKTYNITYTSDPAAGGSVTGSTQAQAGEEVIARLTVNDGYTPSVTVDGAKVEDVNGAVTFTMPDHDVTVQATFTRQQATVTLVTNDGQKVDPLYVTTGEKIAKLGDRIWNNHTFAGWYADAEYKTEFDFDAPITGDTTIYAKWTVTVTFDANGGAFGEAETTEVQATVGNPIVPPEEKPTRNGYEFTAWLTEKKDAPTPEDAFDFSVPARDPVTIYAGWLKGAISVTYSTIGNGKIDGPTAVRPGDEITVKASPSGDYAFSSWNITSDVADIFNDVDRDPAEQPIPEYTFTVPENATSVTVEATFIPTKCYIATSVYGSYDTPEVWTLRRFRDDVLGETWYGRLFIKAYYATSPTLVHWFGDAEWFQNFWRDKLDTLVDNLQEDGFESTPYQDKDW